MFYFYRLIQMNLDVGAFHLESGLFGEINVVLEPGYH